jgi:hypothetical protein
VNAPHKSTVFEIILTVLLQALLFGGIATGLLRDRDETVHVEVEHNPAEVEIHNTPGEYDVDTGAFTAYPEGVPAERFNRDCEMVCTHPRSRFRSPDEPPLREGVTRYMLYSDPEHQICACYDPNDLYYDGVTRYIAWRLAR